MKEIYGYTVQQAETFCKYAPVLDVFDEKGCLFVRNAAEIVEFSVSGYWGIVYTQPDAYKNVGMLMYKSKKIGGYMHVSSVRQKFLIVTRHERRVERCLYDIYGTYLLRGDFTVYANGFIGVEFGKHMEIWDDEQNVFLTVENTTIKNKEIVFSAGGYFAIRRNGRWNLYSPDKQLLMEGVKKVLLTCSQKLLVYEQPNTGRTEYC